MSKKRASRCTSADPLITGHPSSKKGHPMTTVRVSEPVLKRAEELRVGDRIAAPFLPLGQAGVVVFLKPHELRGQRWVFVAYVQDNGFHDSTTFRALSPVQLEYRVDLGASFDASQMADADATPLPTTRRYEPHFADGNTGEALAVTAGGLVDESKPVHFDFDDGHESKPVHFDFDDGHSYCGLSPYEPHESVFADWPKVTCADCHAQAAKSAD